MKKKKHKRHKSHASVDARLWKLFLLEMANTLTLTLCFYLFFLAIVVSLQKILQFQVQFNAATAQEQYRQIMNSAADYSWLIHGTFIKVGAVLLLGAVFISLIYSLFTFLMWSAALQKDRTWRLFRSHILINGLTGFLFFLASYTIMWLAVNSVMSNEMAAYLIIACVVAVFLVQYITVPLIDERIKPLSNINGKYLLALVLMLAISITLALIILFIFSYFTNPSSVFYGFLLICLFLLIIAWGRAFSADWSL